LNAHFFRPVADHNWNLDTVHMLLTAELCNFFCWLMTHILKHFRNLLHKKCNSGKKIVIWDMMQRLVIATFLNTRRMLRYAPRFMEKCCKKIAKKHFTKKKFKKKIQNFFCEIFFHFFFGYHGPRPIWGMPPNIGGSWGLIIWILLPQ
jgi:hypothetical protein